MTFNPDNPNEHEEYKEMILKENKGKAVLEVVE